jgi:hypothetical protein
MSLLQFYVLQFLLSPFTELDDSVMAYEESHKQAENKFLILSFIVTMCVAYYNNRH